jgi:hypothetical protein
MAMTKKQTDDVGQDTGSEAAKPVVSAPEQAAVASAKVKTISDSTHIEKARAARLAAFNNAKK